MAYRSILTLAIITIGFCAFTQRTSGNEIADDHLKLSTFWANFLDQPLLLSIEPHQASVTVKYTFDGNENQTLYLHSSYAHISEFELRKCVNVECTSSNRVTEQSVALSSRIPTIKARHEAGKSYLLTVSAHRMSSEVILMTLSAGSAKRHWLSRDLFSLTYITLIVLIGVIGLIYGRQLYSGLSAYYACFQLCVASTFLLYYGYTYELGIFTPQLTILYLKLLLPIGSLCLLNISQEILVSENGNVQIRQYFRWMILAVQLSIPLMLFDSRWVELGSLAFIACCLTLAGGVSWYARKANGKSAKLLFLAYMLIIISLIGDMALHTISPKGLNAASRITLFFARDHFFSVVTLFDSVLVYYLYVTYRAEEKAKPDIKSNHFNRGTDASDHRVEEKILNIIDQHLHAREFSVEELADRLHVSVSTANRLMRKQFACSPAAMIKKRRMLRAAELVKTRQCRSIIELSLQVGYTDSGYFAKQYRNLFGQDAL